MPTGQRKPNGDRLKITEKQMYEALLAYLTHKTSRKAAHSLGMTETAVRSRIQRAEETYGKLLLRHPSSKFRIPKCSIIGLKYLRKWRREYG